MSRRGAVIYNLKPKSEAAAHSERVNDHLGYTAFAGPTADTANRAGMSKMNGELLKEHDKQQEAINTMGSLIERVVQQTLDQNKELQQHLLQRQQQSDATNKRQLVHPVGYDGESFKPLEKDHEPLGQVQLVHDFRDAAAATPPRRPRAQLVMAHEQEPTTQAGEELMRTISAADHGPAFGPVPPQTMVVPMQKTPPRKPLRKPQASNAVTHKLLTAKTKLTDVVNDMKNMQSIPRKDVFAKLVYVCTTDGRAPYVGGLLMTVILLFLLLFLCIGAVVSPQRFRVQGGSVAASSSTSSFYSHPRSVGL